MTFACRSGGFRGIVNDIIQLHVTFACCSGGFRGVTDIIQLHVAFACHSGGFRSGYNYSGWNSNNTPKNK